MHVRMTGDNRFAIGVKVEAAFQALQKQGHDVPSVGPIVNPYLESYKYASPGGSQGAPAKPCASGCTKTLGELKHLQHYSVYDTRGGFGAPICYKDDVYQVPADWPGSRVVFSHQYE